MTKNKAESIFRESWYDETGKRLLLTCDEYSCLVELTLPNLPQASQTRADQCEPAEHFALVNVEILQQPFDARGLAIGPTVAIYRQRVPCEPLPQSLKSIARFWLPSGLVSRHLRNCYFRVSF